jgi:hypothetical protein
MTGVQPASALFTCISLGFVTPGGRCDEGSVMHIREYQLSAWGYEPQAAAATKDP